jgi:two-component system response regulator CpxR
LALTVLDASEIPATPREGKRIELTAVEFDLLEVLMKNAGTVVTREDLVRTVLGREFSPYDRSIDTHVCNLRKKIGRLKDGTDRIKAIRGTGYLYAKSISKDSLVLLSHGLSSSVSQWLSRLRRG